jgi:hypothetical protein
MKTKTKQTEYVCPKCRIAIKKKKQKALFKDEKSKQWICNDCYLK